MNQVANPLWPRDVLRRDELASRLIPILRTHQSGAVIGIEGEFGSGKTYFLTNLRSQLQQAGLATVYFNAWEADYAQFPLLVLISDIVEELRKYAPKSAAEKLKESAKRLLPLVARVAAKTILRGGSDELDKLFGPIDEEVDRLFSAPDAAAAFGREELKRSRAALTEMVSAARSEALASFPLVVLVDELDRAHPDWIITFLESVKHLLGHQHIVFLVAIDKANLGVLIRHQFGEQYDVEGYLSKFFNYSLNVQSAIGDELFLQQKLIDAGLVSDQILVIGEDVYRGVHGAVSGCIFGLGGPSGNLRRLERCAERLNLCARAMNGRGWSTLLGFLVALSIVNPTLYASYPNGISGRVVIDAIKALRRDDANNWLVDWIVACGIAQQRWGQARSAVRAALGEDRVAPIESLLQQPTFNRCGGHESVAEATVGDIGWLLK